MRSLPEIVAMNAPRQLPRILAVDPGGSCGWAVGDAGAGATGLIASGTWRLDGDRSHPGLRYVRLLHECELLARDHPSIALVAYETPHMSGRLAAEYHLGVIAHLQSWAARHQIPVLSVHSSTLKKHATGDGRADKSAMVSCARQRFGRTPATHDEADAIWIYHYSRSHWRFPRR